MQQQRLFLPPGDPQRLEIFMAVAQSNKGSKTAKGSRKRRSSASTAAAAAADFEPIEDDIDDFCEMVDDFADDGTNGFDTPVEPQQQQRAAAAAPVRQPPLLQQRQMSSSTAARTGQKSVLGKQGTSTAGAATAAIPPAVVRQPAIEASTLQHPPQQQQQQQAVQQVGQTQRLLGCDMLDSLRDALSCRPDFRGKGPNDVCLQKHTKEMAKWGPLVSWQSTISSFIVILRTCCGSSKYPDQQSMHLLEAACHLLAWPTAPQCTPHL